MKIVKKKVKEGEINGIVFWVSILRNNSEERYFPFKLVSTNMYS